MKIEVDRTFPEYFQSAYPNEFELFSHLETATAIPQVLFAITTWKENGQPNVCFHSWSCFHGDRTAFFAVLGGLYQKTHTFANMKREKGFVLNFLSMEYYDSLMETIHHNQMEDNEFHAGGFTPVSYTHLDVYKRQECLRASLLSGYPQRNRIVKK